VLVLSDYYLLYLEKRGSTSILIPRVFPRAVGPPAPRLLIDRCSEATIDLAILPARPCGRDSSPPRSSLAAVAAVPSASVSCTSSVFDLPPRLPRPRFPPSRQHIGDNPFFPPFDPVLFSRSALAIRFFLYFRKPPPATCGR